MEERSRRAPHRKIDDELVVGALRKVFRTPDVIFLVKVSCKRCFERGYTAFRQTPEGRRVVPCRCLLIGKNGKPEGGDGCMDGCGSDTGASVCASVCEGAVAREGARIMGNEWDDTWEEFCLMTPLQWAARYREAGMDGLIELPVKDLVDQRLLPFREGSVKEKVSDELLERFGGQLFDFLKPLVEQFVRSTFDRPWLQGLATLTHVDGPES